MFVKAFKKKTLNAFDDKRFILPDGIHTLAYGHKDISLYRDAKDDTDEMLDSLE